MISANGFPKSGTHALAKAIQLLDVPARVEHIRWADAAPIEDGPRLLIVRDPRDIVVSMLRWRGAEPSGGAFLALAEEWEPGRSIVACMAEYEGWLTDPATLVVRYTDLVRDDSAMRQIAAHLGVPYTEGLHGRLPGMTRTWRGGTSDHRALWSSLVADGWSALGGDDLVTRWGYAG